MFRTTGYDRTLNQIRGLTIELGRATIGLVKAAIHTLTTIDRDTDWRAQDQLIDEQCNDILDLCYHLMSLQQLRERELRWILGHQRIAQELERIADYACDVAETGALLRDGAWPRPVLEMAEHTTKMCEYIVKLMDEAVLEKVDIERLDDYLDERYVALRQGMVDREKQQDMLWGLTLIQARTFERMGDHVVNIAEALEFIEKEE